MARGYDFDEMVDLLDIRQPMKAGDLLGNGQVAMTLREALAIVVEDWANNKFRQLCAIIVGASGYAIRGFDEIKRLYEEVRDEQHEANWQDHRRSPIRSAMLSSTYS
jgi:hypothetical protein